MENLGSGITGLKPTDMAWCAGVIDGEGCLSFNTTPSIRVESVSRSIIERLHNHLGGKCSSLGRRTASNRAVFRWSVYGGDATKICAVLFEFLEEKKNQAVILMRIKNYPAQSETRKVLTDKLKRLKRIS